MFPEPSRPLIQDLAERALTLPQWGRHSLALHAMQVEARRISGLLREELLDSLSMGGVFAFTASTILKMIEAVEKKLSLSPRTARCSFRKQFCRETSVDFPAASVLYLQLRCSKTTSTNINGAPSCTLLHPRPRSSTGLDPTIPDSALCHSINREEISAAAHRYLWTEELRDLIIGKGKVFRDDGNLSRCWGGPLGYR